MKFFLFCLCAQIITGCAPRYYLTRYGEQETDQEIESRINREIQNRPRYYDPQNPEPRWWDHQNHPGNDSYIPAYHGICVHGYFRRNGTYVRGYCY